MSTPTSTGSRYRILRIIEYVGDRDWLDAAIGHRSVKGWRQYKPGCYIQEAIIGETAEIWEEFVEPPEEAKHE